MRRNGGLDAIRVVAALSVFLCHLQYVYEVNGVSNPAVSFLRTVGEHGYVSVTAFFVLSGYLVYRPFVGRQASITAYALRRMARIFPAALFAFAFVSLALPKATSGLAVYWSLYLEIGFYCALPVLAIAVGGRLRRLGLIVGASLAIDAILIWAGLGIALPDILRLPAVLWIFGLGMAIAIVEHDRPQLLHTRWLAPAGAVVIVAGYAVGGRTMIDGLTALGTVFLVAAFVVRPIQSRALSLAAELSYPFYLWHASILLVAFDLGSGGIMVAPIALALTIAASGISVRYFERPCLRAATRMTASRTGHARVQPGQSAGAPLAPIPRR